MKDALLLRAQGHQRDTAPLRPPRGPLVAHSEHPFLTLQMAAGNQAAQTALRGAGTVLQRACACGGGGPSCHCEEDELGAPAQPKLAVSAPGDPYEIEADRVADEVMRMPPVVVGEAKRLQRLGTSTAGSGIAPPIVHDVLRSPGEPLGAAARAYLEPRFGCDFSHVRVHSDARAAESARAIDALAYTVGRDVVFGAGQYSPGGSESTRLLAHELTHVVQQEGNHDSRSPDGRLISSTPESQIQRRVRFFVCNSADQNQVNAVHGLPLSASVAMLRGAADAASTTAAGWASHAVRGLRVSPRSAAVRLAFHDAYAQFPEWVPPWFATLGARWIDIGDLVAQRLQRVADILAGGWIQYYCWGSPARCPECTDSPPAYDACSSFLGKYLICLGPGFWRLWGAGNTDHMALILLHEALHIYFGTTVAHAGRSGNAFCYERYIAAANGRPIQPGDAAACPTGP